MQTWLVNPATGDYIMQNGSPEETNELTMAAYFRLKVKRTQWLYAPDSKYGSDFYLIKKRASTSDPTQIENTAARALQPIADDGRAKQINIDTVASTRNNVGLEVDIAPKAGKVQTLQIPSLGI